MSEQISIPKHVAVIPDGNRRWAKKHALEPWLGHEKSHLSIKKICADFFDAGVEYFTFWAATPDNLTKRPAMEVKFLLEYLHAVVKDSEFLVLCQKYEARVRVVGVWREFVTNVETVAEIEKLETETKNFTRHSITLLLAYDGIREMTEAVQKVSQTPHQITPETIRQALWTSFLPDVDLVVRTGGEPHWSAGFMMWLTANSQFYFTQTLWPDFDLREIKLALEDYASRQRRMGS